LLKTSFDFAAQPKALRAGLLTLKSPPLKIKTRFLNANFSKVGLGARPSFCLKKMIRIVCRQTPFHILFLLHGKRSLQQRNRLLY
jgi:hypothetical protein